MPAVARTGDICTGTALCPPSPIVTGSADVYTNKRNEARLGDVLACGAVIITGSSSVNTNKRPTAREGDMISCGALIACGSPNTYAGD